MIHVQNSKGFLGYLKEPQMDAIYGRPRKKAPSQRASRERVSWLGVTKRRGCLADEGAHGDFSWSRLFEILAIPDNNHSKIMQS